MMEVFLLFRRCLIITRRKKIISIILIRNLKHPCSSVCRINRTLRLFFILLPIINFSMIRDLRNNKRTGLFLLLLACMVIVSCRKNEEGGSSTIYGLVKHHE